jgi:hypothetical protein
LLPVAEIAPGYTTLPGTPAMRCAPQHKSTQHLCCVVEGELVGTASRRDALVDDSQHAANPGMSGPSSAKVCLTRLHLAGVLYDTAQRVARS